MTTPQIDPKIIQSLVAWVASLTPSVESIRVEVGAKGSSSQVGVIATQAKTAGQIVDLVVSLGKNSGWGEDENRKIRLYALTADKGTESTFQRTLPPPQASNGEIKTSDIGHIMIEMRKGQESLLATITHQADIQTRTIEILTDTISHREQTLSTVLEALIETESENAEERAKNLVLTHMVEADEPQESLQSTAVNLLETVVTNLTGGGEEEDPEAPTEEQLKYWFENDPWFADSIRSMFGNKEKPESDEKPKES